jgi:hypothetical protein
MPCGQDESCQRRQQGIHPVNGLFKTLDFLVADGFDGIRQGRTGGGGKAGPDMEQGGLYPLDLPSHIWILLAQRGPQGAEHRIELVHITASFQPLVRLAYTLAAEKTCFAMIARACIDFNGPPPRFPSYSRTKLPSSVR